MTRRYAVHASLFAALRGGPRTRTGLTVNFADLPVLASLTALSLGRAMLHFKDGSSLPVNLPEQPGTVIRLRYSLLVIGQGENSQGYRVPEHLLPTVKAALGLWAYHEVQAPLTLTGIDWQPSTAIFKATDSRGRAVSLSVPHPVFTQFAFDPSLLAGSVNLYVTRGTLGQAFHFEVQPETPEGRAMLELLGYADRAKASSEGHGEGEAQ